MLTWKEYVADTNPTNSLSFLAFSGVNPVTSGVVFVWHGGSLVTQYLDKSTALTGTQLIWTSVFTNLPPATPSSMIFTNSTGINTSGFYRIRATR